MPSKSEWELLATSGSDVKKQKKVPGKQSDTSLRAAFWLYKTLSLFILPLSLFFVPFSPTLSLRLFLHLSRFAECFSLSLALFSSSFSFFPSNTVMRHSGSLTSPKARCQRSDLVVVHVRLEFAAASQCATLCIFLFVCLRIH